MTVPIATLDAAFGDERLWLRLERTKGFAHSRAVIEALVQSAAPVPKV